MGSVPLESAEDVFRTAGRRLGPIVARLPDGETGERSRWIYSQVAVLEGHPDLTSLDSVRTLGGEADPALPVIRQFGRRSTGGVVESFPDLGYSGAAKASYATFTRLRAAGAIPPGTRFQVSLPTPWAAVRTYVRDVDREAVFPPYRARLLAELADLMAHIPHEDLAVQWDVAVEIAEIEGAFEPGRTRSVEDVAEKVAELVPLIAPDVEVGMHFCYGDSGGVHFVQPRDLAVIVALANGLGRHLDRTLSWIHMPVPIDRRDDAYFAPLADLDTDVAAAVFLGLLHGADGLEGALRRMEAASARLTDFGLATECGWGRRGRTSVEALLDLHVAAASA